MATVVTIVEVVAAKAVEAAAAAAAAAATAAAARRRTRTRVRERRRRATQQRRSDDDVDEDEDEDEAAAEDRRADGYAERLRLAWCGPQHGHSVPKVGTTHESCYARRRATKLRRRIALGWPPIECSVERSQGTRVTNSWLLSD